VNVDLDNIEKPSVSIETFSTPTIQPLTDYKHDTKHHLTDVVDTDKKVSKKRRLEV